MIQHKHIKIHLELRLMPFCVLGGHTHISLQFFPFHLKHQPDHFTEVHTVLKRLKLHAASVQVLISSSTTRHLCQNWENIFSRSETMTFELRPEAQGMFASAENIPPGVHGIQDLNYFIKRNWKCLCFVTAAL